MKRQHEHTVTRGPPEKISTETYVSDFDSAIDLFCVFNFLKLDKHIIGMLFGGDVRGKYSVKGRKITKSDKFPNQMSLSFHPEGFGYARDKGVNVKIFSNGKIQMTGCKLAPGTKIKKDMEYYAIDVAKQILNVLHQKFYNHRNFYKEEVENVHGLLIGKKSNRIYNSKGKIIGKKTLNKSKRISYLLEDDDINILSLKSRAFVNLVKYFYNIEGEKIGEQRIVFNDKNKEYLEKEWTNPPLKNNNFLYCDRIRIRLQEKEDNDKEFDLFDRYNSEIIGHTETRMYGVEPVIRKKETTHVVNEYSAFIDREQSKVMDPILSLSNGYYSLGINLNLVEAASRLQEWEMNVEYSPDDYHGLKIYYYPNDECVCMKNDCKCKTTIMIFSTGKVMISTKSIKDMKNSFNVIADFVEQNYDDIVISFEEVKKLEEEKKKKRARVEDDYEHHLEDARTLGFPVDQGEGFETDGNIIRFYVGREEYVYDPCLKKKYKQDQQRELTIQIATDAGGFVVEPKKKKIRTI